MVSIQPVMPRADVVPPSSFRTRRAIVLVAAGLLACGGSGGEQKIARDTAASVAVARADSVERARQDSINRAQPGYVVDSILPPEEEMRRFRDGLTRPTRLDGGATSRDALVSAFITAVEKADTAALRRLIVTRAEYAWLVYPPSRFSRQPYYQPIGLAWRLAMAPSDEGINQLLGRAGGRPLGFVSYNCPRPPVIEADNRTYTGCIVLLRQGNDSTPRRLFGPILERGGRFKFLSFANDQ